MRVTFGRLACVALLGALAAPGCREQRKLKHLPGAQAVLTGRVRIAAGAELPRYAALDLARRPMHERAAADLPESCRGAASASSTPVQLTSEGLLAGIVVGASDFARFEDRKPVLHKVAIRDCRLQPAIIVARGGDALQLENRDSSPFEPMLGPSFAARTLAPGAKVTVPLRAGDVESIACPPHAPCGRTDLVVFFHPVFALTDAHGAFRIEHFPTSQLVRVTAWHPLFEPSETYVWLQPGERAAVELELRPKSRFAKSDDDE